MKKHSKKAAAGSKPSRTVGLDLGDKFCHYCILDGEEGEVMEEGRIKTEEGALRKHFENEERMWRIGCWLLAPQGPSSQPTHDG